MQDFARHPDTPDRIDALPDASLGQMLAQTVARYPDHTAFHNMGLDLSYRELDRQSARLADYLIRGLGLRAGERVALMMPNLLQYPVALYAVLRAGLVAVNVNPLYTARELHHQLADSQARAIVVLENFAQVVEQARADTSLQHVVVTAVGDMLPAPKRWLVNAAVRYVKKLVPPYRLPGAVPFRKALAAGDAARWRDARLAPDALAILQYTGGTTGLAKGAMLSHRNLLANVEQARLVLGEALIEGRAVVATPLPLYHVFALTVNCLLITRLGGNSLLITNPRDLDGLVAELARHPVNAFTGVNTLFNALVHHAGFAKLDFSRWKVAIGGGAAVQQAVAEAWQRTTGLVLLEGYGLTEASPLVSVNALAAERYTGTVGMPVPGTEVELRDDAGRPAADGEPGEVCVRGPQVMAGYWQRPEETAKVFHADGFFATGDIGIRTADGLLKLVDRKKDMVLVSGFNVYPNEVEDVVAQHPGVREVACIGVPDERSGEAVKIVVVRKDPSLQADELLRHCRDNMTAYKVPRHVEFRDALPKSNVGKILRRELRQPA
ncbi:O-succinylbenzoic acid-CoA ligase MenE or related acyl-CoA synthetase (AMP-forming) [Chromobacterium violaceum]|uniref:AMP-binding protein n=1 Tax=Chromobacterium violaceum TaxID=536 RepID=UPI0005B928EA|nr:AMP-binding protein [Chromobacterium violaceum]MBA8733459.1 AMP-binding protein [Chromobacterium violaceum]MBT2865836.1 AMP-binding protein [Chromobacterium violaceum]MBX9266199.1 AMP-binding protein [Chromobacterium violaceum]